ncbi:MAG: hypothetical protein UX88_C0023G0018 [Candidatus Woesebacteria bacterium GW2011_GWC2_47_16]|uniref:Uncharacterized protein n=1 Tax=Candidatus Woesebacteria bacterium GW2011_GWC2_47_16 TaxID=1618590 RepID=A0A0G1S2W9_9BACT|nr:MAG: hypothetical protein UX88_C0023G0018 [Candidatus Woesebacteria bacterium GW2011_GWC2_47_16]
MSLGNRQSVSNLPFCRFIHSYPPGGDSLFNTTELSKSRVVFYQGHRYDLFVRKFFFGVLAATLLIIGIGIFYSTKSSKNALGLPSGYEYYWSTTCPHCAKVQEFIDSWEGTAKISLEKKEINSPANSNLLVRRASSCNISVNDVGVPFLFTPEGKCILGDEPIIEYLKGLKI